MKKIDLERAVVEKVTDPNENLLFNCSPKDKYYKVVWFGKIELAEKYAQKVEHTQKIMVIEDAQ